MKWFAEKTAVVTGAGHGIGRAIAEQLAELGARVVAVDRDSAALADAFGSGPILACAGAVGVDTTEQLVRAIGERAAGPVHCLVNNVGIDTPHTFFALDEAPFDHVFATNLRGPWFLTRAVAQDMIARGGGAILFISSLHDHIVRRRPHYSASKAAVAMLVRELAFELGPHGIRVNAISPGAIDTAQVAEPSEDATRLRELIRLGGAKGRPEHIARMAAVLLSDHWSGYVTGANVPVDGGLGLVTWSQP